MFNKLKQLKDLRDQGKRLQELLSGESASADAAGGKIVLTLDGNLQMSGLAIDPELLTPDKKEKLENGIKEAHREALKKIQRTIATKMQASGMNIPGMSN